MKLVMKATLAMAVFGVLVGCAAEGTEPEGETATENTGTATQAMPIGPSVTFKKKSDLEADGWTCKALEGTSMTFCTEPGTSGSYSCDSNGNCISNMTTPPKTGPKPIPTTVSAFSLP